jgi:DNA-directed RNA polymerase specialized sigma24 family protein
MSHGRERDADPPSARALLEVARRGDTAAFDQLVTPDRGELLAYCYRMLGSLQRAEDALRLIDTRIWEVHAERREQPNPAGPRFPGAAVL